MLVLRTFAINLLTVFLAFIVIMSTDLVLDVDTNTMECLEIDVDVGDQGSHRGERDLGFVRYDCGPLDPFLAAADNIRFNLKL